MFWALIYFFGIIKDKKKNHMYETPILNMNLYTPKLELLVVKI
jgi:hypothetical protein